MKPQRLAGTAVVLGLLGVITWRLVERKPDGGAVAAAATATTPQPWWLPAAGRRFDLRFVTESQQEGLVPDRALTGRAVVAGVVTLRPDRAASRVWLRVEVLDELTFTVLGAPVLREPDVKNLLASEQAFVVDEQGVVVDIVAPGAGASTRSLLWQLAAALQVPTPKTATTRQWTTVTTTPHGRGPVGVARQAQRLEVVREGYDALVGLDGASTAEVDGQASATLDDDDTLTGWSGDETIVGLDGQGRIAAVVRSTVALTATSSLREARPPVVATMTATALADDPAADPAAACAALLAMLDRQLVTGFALDGHAGFRQLVDALVADDSLVAELAARFARAPDRVVDILVATGTPAAQATALRLVQEAGRPTALVQRLAFLRRPEVATLRFVAECAASDDAGARLALGALVGRGLRDPRAEVRQAAGRGRELLRRVVDDDDTPARARALAVRALGNSAARVDGGDGDGDGGDDGDDGDDGDGGDEGGGLDHDDLTRVVAHARDDDARVRGAVAAALRGAVGDEARDTLVLLVDDSAAAVQAAALQALAFHLDDAALRGLEAVAADGGIAPDNAGQVLALLRSRLDEPVARAVLEATIAGDRTDAFTEGLARDLLDTTAPAISPGAP